jgi:hypothetical protein
LRLHSRSSRLIRRKASDNLPYAPLWDRNVGGQKSLAISEPAKKIARKAQQRLHKRYQALAARGKNKNQLVTAIGRELLGFIWAIAIETEKQHKLAKTA